MQKALLGVIVIAAAVAWFFFKQPLPNEVTNTATPAAVPSSVQQQAREHINQLTDGQDKPINIQSADNFVTADQLLNIPEQKHSNAAITEATNSTASGSDGTFAVDSTRLNVISTGSQKNTATQTQTYLNLANQIKLNELLDDPENAANNVYFIHAVNTGDDKGLWGIIQQGLIRTFTEGLKLPGQDTKVFADIPQDADERLHNQQSSFLGQILQNKVKRTYIYNYQKGILGENPDLIKPGQQLVIVTFSEQELIGIYNHFIN
jgi:hypothetical protein